MATPRPHRAARHRHRPAAERSPLLLSLVLFSAGLHVPVRDLGRLLRKPTALLAGLVLQFAIPPLVIPVVAFGLHRTPTATAAAD